MAQAGQWTRSETIVLAALRNAPFGLVSARAVARRSGLSSTAAGRALGSLLEKDLVTHAGEVIAAGRVRDAEIWRANLLHPCWPQLDPALDSIEPPERPKRASQRVPGHLRHLFWNTAESQLDASRAGPYIARRLLRAMDLQGLAWGASVLGPEDWRRGGEARGLEPEVRQLARNLARMA